MPLALVLAQLVAPDLVAVARERTAAEKGCVYSDTADVTVCGRRNADRFRVPLIERSIQPSRDAEPGARAELLHRTTPIQDLSPFLVGGGHVGVSVGTKFGPGTDEHRTFVTGARPPAP